VSARAAGQDGTGAKPSVVAQIRMTFDSGLAASLEIGSNAARRPVGFQTTAPFLVRALVNAFPEVEIL